MSLEFQETFKLQTLTWNYGDVTWRRLKGTVVRRVLPEGAPPLLGLDGNWSAIVSTRGPRSIFLILRFFFFFSSPTRNGTTPTEVGVQSLNLTLDSQGSPCNF